jgi:malto-oligosyltrehalose synthase/4-alpha-glucanotransferase
MYNPVATYRIQFNKDFTFQDFDAIIPYLQKLGVKTIYASPIFEAVPGSTHGYDIINPFQINPEIGTEEQLREISAKLKNADMGWLQDIVPNHMAFHPKNIWLMDVLEKGVLSVYAHFFDVTWTTSLFHGRIMVPVLSQTLEEAVAAKKIYIVYQNGRLHLHYNDMVYPVHSRTYEAVLGCSYKRSPDVVRSLLTQIDQNHAIVEPVTYAFRWHEFILQFGALMKKPETKMFIDDCLQSINESPQMIRDIVETQVYRLCHWQETDQKINYRRFFTINGLICLNMQSEEVFHIYHQKIKQFLTDGIFQGLRVDHIDGLYDPEGYLKRLRKLCGTETYLIVEKILEPNEQLPETWPIQGTTGYDFLAVTNNLFTNRVSESTFSKFYQTITGDKRPAIERIRDKKAYILFQHMGGELENLYQFFIELNLIDRAKFDDITLQDLKKAIGEFLLQCPVYRFYFQTYPLKREQSQALEELFKSCKERKPELITAFNLMESALLVKTQEEDKKYNNRAIRFLKRCMQFSGPLMAKGVEDTLMYTFNRFVGHNEVGDSPIVFGIRIDDFHEAMKERQMKWPLALNTTSTHDTKRGEDVRMRLNIIPLLAEEWIEKVTEWRELNRSIKTHGSPDANDEYFIYQTLVGAFPILGGSDFQTRLDQYLTKAFREAKRYTDWSEPNESYEEASRLFVNELLSKKRIFWRSFVSWHQKIADFGIVNSLAQVLLKFTCPGVPDIYQGTVSWDLSLVDPDNRRPVDFTLVDQQLDNWISESGDNLIRELWRTREDAQIKHWLIYKLLQLRHRDVKVFAEGFYIPLSVEGRYQEHIVAYARRYKNIWYVVAIPINLVQLCEKQRSGGLRSIDWKDTMIVLPKEAPTEFENMLTLTKGKQRKGFPIKSIFNQLPFSLLKLTKTVNSRSSGVLLAMTSLPSAYGIGDMGPEARNFADFLSHTNQTYWQLLPLNPITQANFYSPYSSYSAMAGNTLLISPEGLVEMGLLHEEDLEEHQYPQINGVNFVEADEIRTELLEKAWTNFQNDEPIELKNEFDSFLKKESYWLDDFAIYVILKEEYDDRPWYEWPEEYKHRNAEALQEIKLEWKDRLLKIKWDQFIFNHQWHRLKKHCNNLCVQLFGDLPFYVSYDSVDVWSYPEFFSLDEKLNMKTVSGVPPDYFNSNGQLWGTPVYNWEKLKEQKYSWWLNRVRRNVELFDILRFDHFRAFNDYWEVNASEKTAINGTWRPGPGGNFFAVLKNEFGDLPFVAEDLGDISEDVFKLRDKFALPGMKVLQFAFDEEMPSSIYIPHQFSSNFIVYTGTHDNNTTRGWYRQNTSREDRKRIDDYFGRPVKEKNIAEALITLAFSSVARIAIVPIQDILNLDETARMNTPSSTDETNWSWRLRPDELNSSIENKLHQWTVTYGRA